VTTPPNPARPYLTPLLPLFFCQLFFFFYKHLPVSTHNQSSSKKNSITASYTTPQVTNNTAIMVHLASIPKDHEIDQPLVDGMKKLDMGTGDIGDTFTTTVYGSRFAAEDLPKHEMPECEMPREVAYRMIKDDLSLDGNPMLKYATPLSLTFSILRNEVISELKMQGCS
jgi:hypothetical protein